MVALAPLLPAAQQAIGLSFELFGMVTLAPALAAAVVVILPHWFPGAWPRRGVGAVVAATGAGLAGVMAFATTATVLLARVPTLPARIAGVPVVLFIMVQGIGVLTEEIGWRGVAQRCGESFMRPAVFSAVAGFVFGATHVGYWEHGLPAVLTFSLATMLMSLTITSVFQGSLAQRMVPATVVHLGFNITLNALDSSGAPLGTSPVTVAAAAVMLGVAVAVSAALRPKAASGTLITD